jgi:ABC-type oligopeptide transport system ATPase subunit
MSWVNKMKIKIEKDYIKKEARAKIKPLDELKKVMAHRRAICNKLNTDCCIFITGMEGSGKSTLASHVVRMLDPEFNPDTGMIYELKGTDQSFMSFMDNFKDTPFKAAWYDEAVSMLFSLNHSNRESAEAQEMFKLKRACRHFDVLVSPSFWDLVPDIRDRRVKIMLYCFVEPVRGPVGSEPEYKYKVAFFGDRELPSLSINKKAKLAYRSPRELFSYVRPAFIEEFPPMDKKFEKDYLKSKGNHLSAVIERVRNSTSKTSEKEPKQRDANLFEIEPDDGDIIDGV